MHTLQPKHTKLTSSETDRLLKELNISLAQLPKIKLIDPSIPENCNISDVVKIERSNDSKKSVYYRVVTV